MELRIVNNHLLVEVETDIGPKICVVDTGSPLTFFYDNVKEYKLGGDTHQLPLAGGLATLALPQREEIEKLIGVEIEGFIGSDSMQRYGDVLMDLRNKEMFFGETRVVFEHTTPMRSLMGVPMFNVSFNGHETLTAFDSGAMYSFISTQFAYDVDLAPTHRTFTDYHPGHGSFEAELHTGTISIANVEFGTHNIATATYYNTILSLLGISAFIGVDALLSGTLLLSYRRHEISVSR